MGEVDRGKTRCAWDDEKTERREQRSPPRAFFYPLPSLQSAYTAKRERGLCGGERTTRYYGHPSPAETAKKCMEITPVITDSRYYGIADTSRGPKVTLIFIVLPVVLTDTLDVFNKCHILPFVREYIACESIRFFRL